MEWSKIKNIVLLMLLAVNLFLLVLVADQERKSAAYQEEARTGAVEILAAANIHMDMEALPPESRLHTMAVERDRTTEDTMARALLGESVKSGDLGPVTYTGSYGEGQFLSDGKFSFTFDENSVPVGEKTPEEHGQQLLEKAGYPCQVLESREQEDGTVLVTVQQLWDGSPVFNSVAELSYVDSSLRSIRGQRLMGIPEPEAGSEPLDVATILLRFLSGVQDGGYVCSEIVSMTAGYEVTMSSTGSAALDPVWLITTNTVPFYVDGTDGTVRQAE